jgi:hypothetical protein
MRCGLGSGTRPHGEAADGCRCVQESLEPWKVLCLRRLPVTLQGCQVPIDRIGVRRDLPRTLTPSDDLDVSVRGIFPSAAVCTGSAGKGEAAVIPPSMGEIPPVTQAASSWSGLPYTTMLALRIKG